MGTRTINKFLNTIQTSLFPALNSELGIQMNPNPLNIQNTKVKYSGTDSNNSRIIFEFLSNHVDINESSKGELFLNTYYNSKVADVGIIDLTNISESVELIHGALFERGFRTAQDIEEENAEAERKAKEQEEKDRIEAERKAKEDEEKRIREKKQATIDKRNATRKRNKEAKLQAEQNEKDRLESIETFKTDFDKYFDILKESNQLNSVITAVISMEVSDTRMKMLNIDMTYISPTICLVVTNGINPKIDKTVSWVKAKAYCINVAEAVKGSMSISAVDENGQEIELPDDSAEEENVDIGVNI